MDREQAIAAGLYQNIPLESPEETLEFQLNSAFHPDNIGPALLIQTSRLYDAIMAFLAVVDVEKASLLAEAHAKGEFMTPPPAFKEEEE